jgi:hypothetical protein
MSKTGIILDYGNALDLDPFPCIPLGALYLEEFFLVHHAMNMLGKLGVDHVLVVSEMGAAYLKYAISDYEKNGKVNITYVPETEDRGAGRLVCSGIVAAISDYSQPITLVGSNVITDIDMADLEGFHKARKKPYATVVCVPGVNETELDCPAGYRPVETMLLEKHITRCGDKKKPALGLWDMLADADRRGQCAYYPFDGLYYEVNSEEDYVLMRDGGR